MNCSRTYPQRQIDYSAVRPDIDMQNAIQAFVGRRMAGTVSMRVIQKWLRATPVDYTAKKVDEAVVAGKIEMRRTSTTGFVYQSWGLGE